MSLDGLRTRVPAMIDALATLVEAESPSSDPAAAAACAQVARKLVGSMLGDEGELLTAGGRTHLRWRFGSTPRVVLMGHLDTVWGLGTLDRWPFSVDGDVASGPGCFDMKGG